MKPVITYEQHKANIEIVKRKYPDYTRGSISKLLREMYAEKGLTVEKRQYRRRVHNCYGGVIPFAYYGPNGEILRDNKLY